MKRLLGFLCVMVLSVGMVGMAGATLIDNYDGTITQIRNNGSQLMWLKDANYAQTAYPLHISGALRWYDEAIAFIDFLNANNHLGFHDWRLPENNPVNGFNYNDNESYDGSTDRAYNITSQNSEMAYLFYIELNNKGYFDASGSGPQVGWGDYKTGPFDNLIDDFYWSGTEHFQYSEQAWAFDFDWGLQTRHTKEWHLYVLPVRDMPPIPEPTTMLLFGSGLIGLVGFRRKFKKS